MRRALVLSALLALGLAAPAQAQFEPAPNVVRFTPGMATPFEQSGATFSSGCSGGRGQCSRRAAGTAVRS